MIHNTKSIIIDINGTPTLATIRTDGSEILHIGGISTIFRPSDITTGYSDYHIVSRMWNRRDYDSWISRFKHPSYNVLPNGKYIFNIN